MTEKFVEGKSGATPIDMLTLTFIEIERERYRHCVLKAYKRFGHSKQCSESTEQQWINCCQIWIKILQVTCVTSGDIQ